MEDSDCRV